MLTIRADSLIVHEVLMKLLHLVAAVAVLLCLSTAAQAQVQTVLGVGVITFEVGSSAAPITQPAAQAQKYRVYAPPTAASGVVVTATCGQPTSGASTCNFPIAQIPNIPTSGSVAFAITSAVTAADGELEGAKVTGPFSLQKAAPPADPHPPMSIRPPTP